MSPAMNSIASGGRSPSQRCCANNILSVILLLLVAFVSGQTEYSVADLEAMTEVELENICIQRGFQLVNDQGDELTKQDYIEAAQRCLAIEQEMNELLTQYPELADELEEEIKRMERENAEKQAYVEGLENQLTSDEGEVKQEAGMAFHRGRKSQNSVSDGEVADDVESDNLVMSEEVSVDDPEEAFTQEEVVEDDEEEENTPTEDREESYSEIETDAEEDDEEMEDLDADETETEADEEGTEVETPKEPTKDDLSMTTLAIESLRVLVKNAQDDVKRIISLTIPVLQPLFNAGDVAWRQMKSLFLKAREYYEAYQAINKHPSEGTEVAETCEDSVAA